MAHSTNHPIHSLPTDKTGFYPESDGKPMAETDVHRNLMIDLIKMLETHFHDRSDVYVSGNLLLYYEEGNPKKSVALDVFVVKGVENKPRRTYLLWQEGQAPNLVFELSSKGTYLADSTQKKTLYAQVLEVKEYFIYDPDNQYLDPVLQGYRLVDSVYLPILPVNDRLPSEQLGLEFGLKPSGDLGVYDPQTREWLLTPNEQATSLRRAEAELERLRAELRRVSAHHADHT